MHSNVYGRSQDLSAGPPKITAGHNVKMDENGRRFLLEKAEECRRRAEQAPTENVRRLSLKMAEQLAWYARPEMSPPPPMYTIRAELEYGGVSLKGAPTAAEALECLETMTGRNLEIAGPRGETLTKSELLVRLSREARGSREPAAVTVLRTAVA